MTSVNNYLSVSKTIPESNLDISTDNGGDVVFQSRTDTKDIVFKQFDGSEVVSFTDSQHVEIQGGLKIGLGGKDYGRKDSSDATKGQLFIQSTHSSNTSGEAYGWWIGTQDETVSTSDNDLQFVVVLNNTENVVGWLAEDGSGAVNFTGQHRCFINNELSDMVGLLVSSTGTYVNINNSNQPSINESLPICQLSTIVNDKSVFGVVSEKEDTNSNRTYKPSNFVSCYKKTNTNERRYHINSLGEGSIWITNKNNNLQNGDYITTSTISGYGQKQTETQLHNYTVAKITCNCNFSITKINKRKVKVIVSGTTQTLDLDSSGNIQFEDDLDSEGNQQQVYPFTTRFLLATGTQITETDYTTRSGNGESVYIACFVGCTYHCG